MASSFNRSRSSLWCQRKSSLLTGPNDRDLIGGDMYDGSHDKSLRFEITEKEKEKEKEKGKMKRMI